MQNRYINYLRCLTCTLIFYTYALCTMQRTHGFPAVRIHLHISSQWKLWVWSAVPVFIIVYKDKGPVYHCTYLRAQRELRASPLNPKVSTLLRSEKSLSLEVWCFNANKTEQNKNIITGTHSVRQRGQGCLVLFWHPISDLATLSYLSFIV